ncbi:MAG: thiol oxidoreductase [Deltaproteobacteria bacterium]|nr:thiol oxidoreductase [Deltaproteobacteria bacterium]
MIVVLTQSCGGTEGSINGNANVDPRLEINEEFSGGDTTVFINTNEAFSKFAKNLTLAQQSDFKLGNSFFEQDWVSAPASTKARDGLGPTFNANSCASCHAKDGRGAAPLNPDEEPIALLLRISIPGETPEGAPLGDPHYGDQIQNRSILNILPEASVSVGYEEVLGTYVDGESYSLRQPIYSVEDLNFGELDPDVMISPRIAPQMIGMGLLEAIPESTLQSLSDPEDLDGDGISGRLNYVWDVASQSKQVGRFGWKANQPSVRQQVAGAFLGDIGITSSFFPNENCPPAQLECLESPNGGSPELQEDVFDLVTFYSQTLAVPARRNWTDPTVLEGKVLFKKIGCTKCHTPQHVTSLDYPVSQLAGQTIRPYTDLLLHDMGPGLADGRPDFEADGSEWRTPPLWGIGLIKTVNGHNHLLHDGRARGFAEAILWHGGEATEAKEKFRQLNKIEREALIKFLGSL